MKAQTKCFQYGKERYSDVDKKDECKTKKSKTKEKVKPKVSLIDIK